MADELRDSLTPTDEQLESAKTFGKIAAIGGLLGAGGHYSKRLLARGVNTLGFGNVTGSYASNPKPVQYLDDLFTAGEGKRRNIPMQILKTLPAKGRPAELSAAIKTLDDLEIYMSKIRSQGGRISAKLKNFYLNAKQQLPERRMAQAVIQRSLGQPIAFSHGGNLIEGTYPQKNPHIAKALANKGLNIKNPLPVMDVSDDKFMIKKLRAGAAGDPRLKYITKLLKQNRIKDAKTAAKKGLMEYKGQVVRSNAGSIRMFRDNVGNWVTKYVPHYMQRGGKLSPFKEYVVGGHTQMTTFGPHKGLKGLHKIKTDMFDITTYRSAGETIKSASSIPQKGRVALGGPIGQTLKIHTPVVTLGSYKHNTPGGGRPYKSPDIKPRKSRKLVESGSRTYSKGLDLIKKYGWKGAKLLLTKGRKF